MERARCIDCPKLAWIAAPREACCGGMRPNAEWTAVWRRQDSGAWARAVMARSGVVLEQEPAQAALACYHALFHGAGDKAAPVLPWPPILPSPAEVRKARGMLIEAMLQHGWKVSE